MTGKQYADKKYSNLEEGLKGIIAKVFEDGLKQHEHDYLVKTKDLKANCDFAIEGKDVKIMELEKQVKDLEWQLQEVAKDNDYFQAENKRLEKENAKLKSELTKKADTNHSIVEQMARLEEENADLEKKYFNNIIDCEWCDTYCNSQLTIAKEIIEELIEDCKSFAILSDCEPTSKEIEQAEQFLKEI